MRRHRRPCLPIRPVFLLMSSCRMMICSRVREDLLGGCVDVLSEVLQVVKLQGATFYKRRFSFPWSLCQPASRTVAPYLAA